jgi:hypothetical protein
MMAEDIFQLEKYYKKCETQELNLTVPLSFQALENQVQNYSRTEARNRLSVLISAINPTASPFATNGLITEITVILNNWQIEFNRTALIRSLVAITEFHYKQQTSFQIFDLERVIELLNTLTNETMEHVDESVLNPRSVFNVANYFYNHAFSFHSLAVNRRRWSVYSNTVIRLIALTHVEQLIDFTTTEADKLSTESFSTLNRPQQTQNIKQASILIQIYNISSLVLARNNDIKNHPHAQKNIDRKKSMDSLVYNSAKQLALVLAAEPGHTTALSFKHIIIPVVTITLNYVNLIPQKSSRFHYTPITIQLLKWTLNLVKHSLIEKEDRIIENATEAAIQLITKHKGIISAARDDKYFDRYINIELLTALSHAVTQRQLTKDVQANILLLICYLVESEEAHIARVEKLKLEYFFNNTDFMLAVADSFTDNIEWQQSRQLTDRQTISFCRNYTSTSWLLKELFSCHYDKANPQLINNIISNQQLFRSLNHPIPSTMRYKEVVDDLKACFSTYLLNSETFKQGNPMNSADVLIFFTQQLEPLLIEATNNSVTIDQHEADAYSDAENKSNVIKTINLFTTANYSVFNTSNIEIITKHILHFCSRVIIAHKKLSAMNEISSIQRDTDIKFISTLLNALYKIIHLISNNLDSSECLTHATNISTLAAIIEHAIQNNKKQEMAEILNAITNNPCSIQKLMTTSILNIMIQNSDHFSSVLKKIEQTLTDSKQHQTRSKRSFFNAQAVKHGKRQRQNQTKTLQL